MAGSIGLPLAARTMPLTRVNSTSRFSDRRLRSSPQLCWAKEAPVSVAVPAASPNANRASRKVGVRARHVSQLHHETFATNRAFWPKRKPPRRDRRTSSAPRRERPASASGDALLRVAQLPVQLFEQARRRFGDHGSRREDRVGAGLAQRLEVLGRNDAADRRSSRRGARPARNAFFSAGTRVRWPAASDETPTI